MYGGFQLHIFSCILAKTVCYLLPREKKWHWELRQYWDWHSGAPKYVPPSGETLHLEDVEIVRERHDKLAV